MDKDLFDRIVQQLLPEMSDPGARQALVQSALFGSPVISQIDWSGAAAEFTVRLINRLYLYDLSALIALLEEVRRQVGSTRQRQIDQLTHELTTNTHKGEATVVLESAVLIGFLIEVGRWAKSELSETWRVRRAQQEATLTDHAQVEAVIPAQFQNIVAEKSEREVQRIMELIERKRDAIHRARNAKLADREQFDRQEVTQAAFEQRTQAHTRTIQQMMNEIADDLTELGFDVER